MAFKVRVGPAVAALRGGAGTRRRGGQEWSRQWRVVDTLPDGVKDDPQLEVVKISAGEAEKLRPERLGGEQKATTGDGGGKPAEPPPPIPEDLAALTWPELQKLGGAHGVTGKKAKIIPALEALRAKDAKAKEEAAAGSPEAEGTGGESTDGGSAPATTDESTPAAGAEATE